MWNKSGAFTLQSEGRWMDFKDDVDIAILDSAGKNVLFYFCPHGEKHGIAKLRHICLHRKFPLQYGHHQNLRRYPHDHHLHPSRRLPAP